jgi:hypothetical protein
MIRNHDRWSFGAGKKENKREQEIDAIPQMLGRNAAKSQSFAAAQR